MIYYGNIIQQIKLWKDFYSFQAWYVTGGSFVFQVFICLYIMRYTEYICAYLSSFHSPRYYFLQWEMQWCAELEFVSAEQHN